MTIKKLYCYVDETGQDTKGEIFVVSVIFAEQDRDEVVVLLESLERETGKKATKWKNSSKTTRAKYIKEIFSRKIFKNRIFYSLYNGSRAYKALTILTVATAINAAKVSDNYKVSVFIDGLQKTEISVVGTNLRKIGVHVEKVRGVRDESNAIIRLADCIAGFVREYSQGSEYTKDLYKLGRENNTLSQVGLKK